MKLKQGIIGNKSLLLASLGYLAPSVTYTRTGIATGETPTGDAYEVAANVRRFNADNELIWEGQRTDSIRNPRAEGAIAGTPGTWPTNWASNGAQGSVVGSSTEGGIPYFEHRFNSGATTTFSAILDTTVAASVGQAWTGSFYTKLVSGSLTNVSFTQIAVAFFDGVGGTGTNLANNVLDITPTSADLWTQRRIGTFTAPTGTLSVQLRFRYVTIGAHDFTLRIGAPQLEQGDFASSTILPPVGTPGTSTRGPDTGVFNTTPTGSIVFAMRPGQAAPTSINQVYVTINAGSDANRWEFGCQAAGNNLLLTRVVSGTGNNTASVGTQVPGGMVVGVLTWDSAGNGAVKVQGGTYRSSSSGPTGMVSGRLGNRISGAAALFGTIAYAQLLPNRYLSEAAMDAEIAKLSGYT